MRRPALAALAVTAITAAIVAVPLLGPAADAQPAAAPAGDASANLDKLVAAMRATPVFKDHLDLRAAINGNQQSATYDVLLGPDGEARLAWPNFRITVEDGTVYVMTEKAPHKYFAKSFTTNPAAGCRDVFGPQFLPLQLALRYSDDKVAQIEALGFGQLANPRLVERDNGAFGIDGDNGSATFRLDANDLIKSATLSYTPPNAPPSIVVEVEANFTPERLESLPEPIEFEAGDRLQVAAIEDLHKVSVGEPAPDFTLESLDGALVTLSDLRGHVVVLDFWATWCGPCKRGLPLLERVYRWTEQESVPVHVFAVDVWEKFPAAEQKKQAVRTFWERERFRMPTLLDLDDEVAGKFGFRSIPTTVIIGPDGRVAQIHRGFEANMHETIQREVTELLPKG